MGQPLQDLLRSMPLQDHQGSMPLRDHQGSTGKKGLKKGFSPDMHNGYRIVGVDIGNKMRGCLQPPDPLQRGELTGKKDLNETFKPDTMNGCGIMVTQFRTKTLGVSSLLDGKQDMQRKSGSMQHIWLNCKGSESRKGRNKGGWKFCNTMLIWLN